MVTTLDTIRWVYLNDFRMGNHNILYVQSNFNGSNTFGTMQISSRQVKFEPVRVDYSARSGGLIGISFLFSLT